MSHHPASPPPPWHLEGAALVLLNDWRSVLALVHYATSPVGTYDELAVAKVNRHGPTVTTMLVTSAASRQGGRANWGFPKQLGPLCWERNPQHIGFTAGAHRWRFRLWGPSFPVSVNFWTVQELDSTPMRVPCAAAGRVRLAWHGRQIAVLLEPLALTVSAPVRMR